MQLIIYHDKQTTKGKIMSNDTSQSIAQPITQPISDSPLIDETSSAKKQLQTPMALKLLQLGFRIGGWLAPNTAGNIAYKLWFTPPRFKTPDREKTTLASADLKTIESLMKT